MVIFEVFQDILFKEMIWCQEEFGKIVMVDFDVVIIVMNIGGSGCVGNNGNMFIILKLCDECEVLVQQIIVWLCFQFEKVLGVCFYMQVVQDVRFGGWLMCMQFEFILQDVDFVEFNEWVLKILVKMQMFLELCDVVIDQQMWGIMVEFKINCDIVVCYGIQLQLIDDMLYDLFGQWQVMQFFIQFNIYKVILEVLLELQGDLEMFNKFYLKLLLIGEQVLFLIFVIWMMDFVCLFLISYQG